nr:PREDICTED: uncharacterized protein LOC109031610 [Bemisia tabaci]
MRLNKPSELFMLSSNFNAHERSDWNQSSVGQACFHTPASLEEIAPQFLPKFSSLNSPKKLPDDSVAHYKSYTSREELAAILGNERRYFERQSEPLKPPRKTRSPRISNINQNPTQIRDQNINQAPGNLEKFPHDKLTSVIDYNMTTGDPFQKPLYNKPKFQAPAQTLNYNFQHQINSLTDNFLRQVNLNELAHNQINSRGIESAQDSVNGNGSMNGRVTRIESPCYPADNIGSESQQRRTNRNETMSRDSKTQNRSAVRGSQNDFYCSLTDNPNDTTNELIKRNEFKNDVFLESESRHNQVESVNKFIRRGKLSDSPDVVATCRSAETVINSLREFTMNDSPDVDLGRKSGVVEDGHRSAAGGRLESRRAYLERKREKTQINESMKSRAGLNQNRSPSEKVDAVSGTKLDWASRRAARKKKSSESLSSFDVYNIETALPHIDLDAIETHLLAAREEERRRRNDREEIRRRLASGDTEEFPSNNRPRKKPSLQSRLQNGMNLQICFMNETMSDNESPSSDQESPVKTASSKTSQSELSEPSPKPLTSKTVRPLFNNKTQPVPQEAMQVETDFFTQQAKLQADARQALAEAKETARRQMEIERERMTTSPITDMLRASLTKVGVPFPEERRRLSRQLLTNLNVAQLQVIVNDLHTQIEILNEDLVKMLMERDELHMGQDSMLVDIEDLTRYLGAKEKSLKEDLRLNNNPDPVKILTPFPVKSKSTRLTSLPGVKK